MAFGVQTSESEGPELPPASPKIWAMQIIEALPDTVSWDRIQHDITLASQLHPAFEDIRAGRVIDDEDIRAEFGLDED